jgi:signal transduction histidine kinase
VSIADGDYQDEAHLWLPYRWDSWHAVGGLALFDFELPALPQAQGCALHIPRIGMEWRVFVGAQNQALKEVGSYWHTQSAAQGFPYLRPLRIDLNTHMDCTQTGNRLRIQLKNAPNIVGGLSAVYYGSKADIDALHGHSYFWKVTGPYVVTISSGLLGLLGLWIWLWGRDSLFLIYGCSEILWALGMFMSLNSESAFLPSFVYGFIMLALSGFATVFMCAFLVCLVGAWSPRWKMFLMLVLLVAPALFVYSSLNNEYRVSKAHWDTLIFALGGLTTATVWRAALKHRSSVQVQAALSLLLTFAGGGLDWWRANGLDAFNGHIRWIPYTWLAMGLLMAVLLGQRLRQSVRAQDEYAAHLNQRLHEREVELENRHAQDKSHAVESVSQHERLRILRDMHDGLGADLSGALMQAKALEKDQTQAVELVSLIQRSLDHLKISIDTLQEDHGDIPTIAGQLRHRMRQQFEMARIGLAWHVEELPVITDWNAGKSKDLALLLYEAMSNLLMHSGASQAYFEITQQDQAICIRLQDNGRGLPSANDPHSAKRGHGLRNMQERAQRLNAQLSCHNRPQYGGVCVTLLIPLLTSAHSV